MPSVALYCNSVFSYCSSVFLLQFRALATLPCSVFRAPRSVFRVPLSLFRASRSSFRLLALPLPKPSGCRAYSPSCSTIAMLAPSHNAPCPLSSSSAPSPGLFLPCCPPKDVDLKNLALFTPTRCYSRLLLELYNLLDLCSPSEP